MNTLSIETKEFDRVYKQNNPSIFSGGGETPEKNYKILPVADNENEVLVATDGTLKEIQKDYPSAKTAKDTKDFPNPRGFNGDISEAEKWFESQTKKEKESTKDSEKK